MSGLVSTATARGRATTAAASVTGLLATSPDARQVVSFAGIGIASTIAYVVAYAGLRSAVSAPLANGLALIATAVGNTAANRRLTFNVRGSERLAHDHLAGLVAFGIALAITSGAIWLLGVVTHDASRVVELATLIMANAAATVVRFLVLRRSIGRPVRRAPTEPLGEA